LGSNKIYVKKKKKKNVGRQLVIIHLLNLIASKMWGFNIYWKDPQYHGRGVRKRKLGMHRSEIYWDREMYN
jgi:hypothetical protein